MVELCHWLGLLYVTKTLLWSMFLDSICKICLYFYLAKRLYSNHTVFMYHTILILASLNEGGVARLNTVTHDLVRSDAIHILYCIPWGGADDPVYLWNVPVSWQRTTILPVIRVDCARPHHTSPMSLSSNPVASSSLGDSDRQLDFHPPWRSTVDS